MRPISPPQAAVKTRILVVDDDSISARIAARVARFGGFTVQECHGAKEAMRLACSWNPDLVVSDVKMPGIDGPELCVLLKAYPATKHIPILLVSGYPDFDQDLLGRFCGSGGFLAKPFTAIQLLRAINRLLGLVAV